MTVKKTITDYKTLYIHEVQLALNKKLSEIFKVDLKDFNKGSTTRVSMSVELKLSTTLDK